MSQNVIFRLSDISAKGLTNSSYSFSVGNGNAIKVDKDKVQAVVSLCHDTKCSIRDVIDGTGIPSSDIIYIVSMMIASGSLALAPSSSSGFDQCRSLNKAILDSRRDGAPYSYLVYPGFSTASSLSVESMLVASHLGKSSTDAELISSFVSTAEALEIMSNGVKLSGKKLAKFAQESVSAFKDKVLPPLLRSSALSSS